MAEKGKMDATELKAKVIPSGDELRKIFKRSKRSKLRVEDMRKDVQQVGETDRKSEEEDENKRGCEEGLTHDILQEKPDEKEQEKLAVRENQKKIKI